MKRLIEEELLDKLSASDAGTYGFSLTNRVKNCYKAIHMASATQLLFGVRGRRLETDLYQSFSNFMVECWVRPEQSETPKKANLAEWECYLHNVFLSYSFT